jgi:5,10-methylenetetrahydromethanopterin reductase
LPPASRLITAFGTGYTSRSTIGQKPVRWADLTGYVQQVQGLLRGEVVEINGQPLRVETLDDPGRPGYEG